MSLLRATCRSVRVIQRENTARLFSASPVCNEKSVAAPSDKSSQEPSARTTNDILQGTRQHRVNGNLEKRFLVWSGKYKRTEDVPPTVPYETMDKARNKARIKIANYMILATIVGCIGFAYSGKQAAKRGESVAQMNLDWHKHQKDETKTAETSK